MKNQPGRQDPVATVESAADDATHVDPKGIRRTNLMVVSEHSATPARPKTTWFFRIELDTELDDEAEAATLKRLLRSDLAQAKILIVEARERRGLPVTPAIVQLIDAAFTNEIGIPDEPPSAAATPVVQIIEDFAAGAPVGTVRIKLDAPERPEVVGLEELRRQLDSRTLESARESLSRIVGDGDRAQGVVRAALDGK